jgi:hypothetical protein
MESPLQRQWYDVLDIVDNKVAVHKGGGNIYTLEGVGPVHHSEIEDLEISK